MSYWNAPGGRLGCACLRIAIATSLLWMLARMHVHAVDARSAIYYPHGIWRLYPGRPPPELRCAIAAIAWGSTIALLVGLRTRTAHAVSAIAVLAVATYEISSMRTWSHHNVPPLLAAIAFFGARGGDTLSIDAWWRRRRGLPPADHPGDYQWSLRLVLIAVASVFFVAAYHKLASGGSHVGWVFSDNLRNQLVVRFDAEGRTRTAAADWLIARAWRFHAAAVLNVVAQLLPIGAAWFVDHPRLRVALGLVWVAEVIGLGLVMAWWNVHWLPLAAAFVDWDHLAGSPPEVELAPRRPRVFASGFLVVYALQAFVLDQRLNLYPFSSFPMFASIRAKRPLDRHQSYEIIGGHIVLVSKYPVTTDVDRRGAYRRMWKDRRPDVVRRDLQMILDDSRARLPQAAITGVRLVLSVDQVPAYPAAVHLERHDLAIIGELDVDGEFRTSLGSLRGMTLIAPDCPHLIAYRDDLPDPIDVAAHRAAGGFVLDAPVRGDPVYFACDRGDRWLIAQQAHRGY